MTTTTDIYALAGEAYDQFETVPRSDGECFTRLKDSAPDWLKDLVRAAHGDMLPDDWRYSSIRAALGFIHDNPEPDTIEDGGHDFADSNVDTYNSARVAWLASSTARAFYCDDAVEEGLASPEGGIFERLGLGQYMESLEVWASVTESLTEYVESLEGDE